MYRQAVRSSSRAAGCLRPSALRASPRRFASTAPADKPRTWKGSALRWGLAFAAVYYYNTSPVFADEPSPRTTPEPPQFSDTDLKTVDALIEEKRQKSTAKAQETAPTPAPAPAPAPQPSPSDATSAADPGSPEALEEEAGQQGAFNPETGEINWDCPCLGGMAHGPCGEEFKSAFSCFVYSTEEPKGMDCIEKFQGMQDCFRKHPEVYGAELQDDEDAAEEGPPAVTPDGDASPLSEPTEALPSEGEKATATKMPGGESKLLLPVGDEHDKYEPRQAAEAAPAETPQKFSDATDANAKE